ncbi:MAG: hypothetical protein EHJ95_00475 [Methanobacteriota archaeon]|nr:MAG: hypothetical protein EHJ95_00475 [Euryarchaeota archaeon]
MLSTDRTLAYLLCIALACCFAAGCTGEGMTSTVPSTTHAALAGTGISDITPVETSALISLANAHAEFTVYWTDDRGNNGTPDIYQVNGVNVNADGMASAWICGVRQNGSDELVSFDGSSWKPMTWPVALPAEAIDWDAVISPEDLYAKNQAEITGQMKAQATDVSSLWLKDGRYTVMIGTGHNISSLTFDATTGEMIAFD